MATTTMHLRSPGELITAIPYILDSEPTNSLIAIALKDGRVGLTSRIDLRIGPPQAPGTSRTPGTCSARQEPRPPGV
jgi:hypothetical protein